jgi:methionine aminopeptidase
MDAVEESLRAAQGKAETLYAEVVATGMIRSGIREDELSLAIDALARERFGLRRHWHRRVVRSGPHTVLNYYDGPSDRLIEDGDLVVLDFGPVFGEWEADYGKTYLVGHDPVKAELIRQTEDALRLGRSHYESHPDLTAGEMYDYVVQLGQVWGWEFGASTAGHLIGHFPHEGHRPDQRFVIEHGNPTPLNSWDARGQRRHWILEIHFVDRTRGLGAFVEELLTL